MTVIRLLRLAKELSPSTFSEDTLLMWISQVENILASDVAQVPPEELTEITEPTNAPMLVPHPFDRVYLPYVQAQIAYAQGETDLYQNYLALYNAYRDEWIAWVRNGKWRHSEWYLSAYNIAVEHGYSGTIDEWLNSLTGEKGEKGDSVVLLGSYQTLDELMMAHPVGHAGDYYAVGVTPDTMLAYYWDPEASGWRAIDLVDGQRKARESAQQADMSRAMAQQAAESAEKNAGKASTEARNASFHETVAMTHARTAKDAEERANEAAEAAEAQVDRAAAEADRAKGKAEDAEASAQRADEAAQDARETAGKMEQELPEIQRQIDTQGTWIGTLRETVNLHDGKIDQLINDTTTNTDEIDELRETVDLHDGKIDQLINDTTTNTDEIDELQETVGQQGDRIALMAGMIGTNSADIADLKEADEQQKAQIDAVQSIADLNATDLGLVHQSLNRQETRIGRIETLAEINAATISELYKSNEKMNAQLENLIVAGDGKIYSKSVDSSEAYSKSVPANVLPNAVLESFGGHSEVADGQIISAIVDNVVVNGCNLSPIDHVTHPAGRVVGDVRIPVDLPSGVYTMSIDLSEVTSFGSPGAAIMRYNVDDGDTKYLTRDKTSATVTGRITSIYVYGSQSYAKYTGTLKLKIEQGTTASPYTPYIEPIVRTIPQEIRSLSGYGMSLGGIYNEVDIANRRYIQRVTVSGGEIVTLAEPIITDISGLITANFEVLPVEDGGTVTFRQEGGTTLPVPSTITFPVKIGGDSV